MVTRLLLRELGEALLPQRCIVCGRFGAALHRECIASLPAAEGERCACCGAPAFTSPCAGCRVMPPAFEALRARFTFTDAVRRALLEAKFRGVTTLIEPLAEAAADAVPETWGIEAVVPIPLHRKRQRERGYNQAELAARAIARRLDVSVDASLLRRVVATPPQAGLDAAGRRHNLAGAFRVEPQAQLPRAVLLVDDVTTTGATFEAAAHALLAAGCERVYALALARED